MGIFKKSAITEESFWDIQEQFRELSKLHDRVVAIMGGTIIEHGLEYLLKTKFRPLKDDDLKNLFDGTAPLATFSAKIRVAYAMNLITRDIYKDLLNYKDIRNSFAHHMDNIDFDERNISQACKNLTLPSKRKEEFPEFDFDKSQDVIIPMWETLPDDSMMLLDAHGRVIAVADPDPSNGVDPKGRFIWETKLLWLRLISSAIDFTPIAGEGGGNTTT